MIFDSRNSNSDGCSVPLDTKKDVPVVDNERALRQALASSAAFKVMSFMFFLVFVPLFNSLLTDLSCTGGSFCLPQVEVEVNQFSPNTSEQDAVVLDMATTAICYLSGKVLTSPFNEPAVSDMLTSMANHTGTVYKLNHYGYCKGHNNCKSLFGATDLSSVLLKDVLDEYSPASSGRLVSAFRSVLGKIALGNSIRSNKIGRFAAQGYILAMAAASFKICLPLFEFAALVCLILSIWLLRSTPAGSMPAGSKPPRSSPRHRISQFIFASQVLVFLAMMIELFTLFEEQIYFSVSMQVLKEVGFPVVHHYNYMPSGALFHVANVCLQFAVLAVGSLLLIQRPWESF